MIRYFLIRLVLPLILFLVVRYLLHNLFGAAKQAGPAGDPRTAVPSGGELKRDPVCGTYVAAATSLTREVKGQTHYFCSKECRDKYRAA
jgi:YHS domain-containing protein